MTSDAEFKQSLSGTERALWRLVARSQIASEDSLFHRYKPRYGSVGAAKLVSARAWIFPAFFCFVMIVVGPLIINGSSYAIWNVGWLVLGLVCVLQMLVRGLKVIDSRKRD